MIKLRVIQLIEFKGIPKEKFYKEIGVTSANFRGKAKETPLNSTAIDNIFSIIPDVNLEWLITGKGEMLKSTTPDTITDSATLQLQNKLIAMQEKEIARLEKLNSELRIVAAGLSQSPGNVTSRLVEAPKELIKK